LVLTSCIVSTQYLRKDDDDWVKRYVTLEVDGARQRGKDINDLHIKLSDA